MPDRSVSTGSTFPMVLLVLSLVAIAISGLSPHYPQDWLLENVLVLVALPLLVAGFRWLRFSDAGYAALFAFLLLHEVGAHYTYSEVPYDRWFATLSGSSLDEAFGFRRNQFDRLVHFMYGLLITPAAVELVALRASPRGGWRWILPWSFVMSHSMVYELLEWAAAIAFGGNLGEAYLGTQGDPWDAQQDMLLAMLGSIAAIAILIVATRLRRIRCNARQGAGNHP